MDLSRSSPAGHIALALALLSAAGCSGGDPAPDDSAPAAQSTAKGEVPGAPAPGETALRKPGRVEAKLVPPGAAIGADPDSRSPALTFQVREEPASLLDWFRATGNGADFVLESELQEGDEHVFSGRVRATGEAYTLRVAPGANGGTTGMVMVTAR